MADPQLTFPFGVDDNGNPVPPSLPPGGGVANQYASPPMATPSEQVSANPYQDAIAAHINAVPTSQQSALVQAVQDQQRAQALSAQSVSQSSGSQTSGMTVTPEMRKTQANLEAARNKEAADAETLGAMHAAKAEEMAVSAQDKATKLEAMAADQLKAQQAHAQDMERLAKEQATTAAQYEKEAKNLDPERLMTGGKRVAAAFAMAFGAYGATLGKTQNFAMQIVNDAMDRDYQGQKDRLAGTKEKLTLSQQAIQNSRAQFSDDAAARADYRGTMLMSLGAFSDAVEARHKGGIAKQEGLSMGDKLRAEGQAEKLKALQMEAPTRSQSSSTTVSKAAPTVKTTADLIKEATDRANMKIATDKAYGPKGPTDQDNAYANKVREQISGLGQVVVEGRKLNEARAKESWMSPGDLLGISQDARDTDMIEGRVRNAKILAETGKASTEADLKRVDAGMYGGARTNAGKIDAFNKSNNLDVHKIHSELNQMHPQLKAEAIERIKAAFPPEIAEAIVNGTDVRDWSAGGPGGTVRNKK